LCLAVSSELQRSCRGRGQDHRRRRRRGHRGWSARRNGHRRHSCTGGEAYLYRRSRQQLGRSILLGLELLVAADIIPTVAVTPTLTSVAVLGGIVPIRTFLSFSLQLEISGRWPWQKPDLPAPRTEGR